MAKMKYWNGSAWVILDAKDADTLDGKHASAFATAAQGTKADNAETKASADTFKSEKGKVHTVGGTANALTVTTGGSFALTDGNWIKFKAAYTNTGAVTLNVDAKGVKSIKNSDGTALAAGDLEAGIAYEAFYSTGNGFFTLRLSGAKLDTIIAAVEGKGGTIAEPKKVPEIVTTINRDLGNPIRLWTNETRTNYTTNNAASMVSRLSVSGEGWLIGVEAASVRYYRIVIDGVDFLGTPTVGLSTRDSSLLIRFNTSMQIYSDNGLFSASYVIGSKLETATPHIYSGQGVNSTMTLRQSATGSGWIYGFIGSDYRRLIVDGVTITEDKTVGTLPLLFRFNTGFSYYSNYTMSQGLLYTLD